jgi:hypothetical protein
MKRFDYQKFRLERSLSFARYCIALFVLMIWALFQPSLAVTLSNVAIGILVGKGLK